MLRLCLLLSVNMNVLIMLNVYELNMWNIRVYF